MTRQEFAKGWKLLILQPCGWRYRGLTVDGQPTEESRAQMEFYYDNLKWAHPEAWWKVASDYAQGREWPSLSELRQSLSVINRYFVKAIANTSTKEFVPMPEEIRQKLARLGVGQNDFEKVGGFTPR